MTLTLDKREVRGSQFCTGFRVAVGLTMIYCYYIDTVSPVSRYMGVILLIPEGRVTPVTPGQSEGSVWTVRTNQKPGIVQEVSLIKKSMLRRFPPSSAIPWVSAQMACVMLGWAGYDLWSVMSLVWPQHGAWVNIGLTPSHIPPAPPICTSYKYQPKETWMLRKRLKSTEMGRVWEF